MSLLSLHKKNIFFILFFSYFLLTMLVTPALATTYEFTNPLGDAEDPNEIIAIFIRAALGILGAVCLLMFIYAGFLWMFNVTAIMEDVKKERVNKAKKVMVWTVVGMVVVLASYGITELIFNVLVNATAANTIPAT